MKDIEIIISQDKSWVRLKEYQKVKEENEQLKAQIKKMKRCENCRHSYHDRYHTLQCLYNCINFDKWEIAE